ncbi:hypothetical protein D3C75_629220 [compost metagenome]
MLIAQPAQPQPFDAELVSDRRQRLHEDKLPDIAQHQAPDQIGREQRGAEEILQLDPRGHQKSQNKAENIDQDNGSQNKLYGQPQ